jgi:cell division protein FtsW (lipid II flippase)
MQNLNQLIPSNSGWQLILADSINVQGQITGQGNINGQQHAFLLTPVAN